MEYKGHYLPIHVRASLDGATDLSPKPKANPTATPINTLIISALRDRNRKHFDRWSLMML